MKTKTYAIVALVAVLFALCGCSSSQLRDRAGDLDNAADRIQGVLDQSAGLDDSELVADILDAMPEGWQDTAADVIEQVGDAREAAGLIVPEIRAAADKLEAQADAEAGKWENTLVGGLTLIELLLGSTTVLSGTVAGIFGARRRRDRNALEDVVSSIEASTIMVDAISKGGGAELRASMNADTQKAVRSIRNKING